MALTVKTASGIATFVDEKNYGKWFNDLYAIVKTHDACHPELAVEPSCSELSSMIDENSEEGSTNEASTSTSSNKERLVINKRSRKKKKQDVINEALNVIKSAIEKDPTKEVLSYLRDESEKAREHELKVMQMLTQSLSTFQSQQMYNMQPKYPEYTCEGGSQAWQHTQMLQPPNQKMAGHMVFLIHLLVDFVQFTVSYFVNVVELCTCLLTMFMLVVAVFAEPSGCAMLAASQC